MWRAPRANHSRRELRSDAVPVPGTEPFLVAGLGNPGPQYAGNRHNIGYQVVDELASRASARFTRRGTGFEASGIVRPPGPKLVLLKPLSFMNLSGGPVAGAAKYYRIPSDRVIVIHDDLDLPFGALRLKAGGGHGGHNGLRDVVKALGTDAVLRVRLGIGRPTHQDAADYVLRDFQAAERAALPGLVADAADAIEQLTTEGLLAAQQRVHAPREPPAR